MSVKDAANYTIQRVTLPKTSCYKVNEETI